MSNFDRTRSLQQHRDDSVAVKRELWNHRSSSRNRPRLGLVCSFFLDGVPNPATECGNEYYEDANRKHAY